MNNKPFLSGAVVFTLLLLGTLPVVGAPLDSDLQRAVSQAKTLLREGDALNDEGLVTQAHEMLQKVHEQSPGRETLYFLAQAEYELVRLGVGDKETRLYERFLDPALEKVESIKEIDEGWSEGLALYSMVQGYRIAGNPLNAMTAGPRAYYSAEEAIRLDSTNPRAWLVRGIAKLNAPSIFGGDKHEALVSLQRAVSLFERQDSVEWSLPDWGYLDALVWGGWAYEQTDRPTEARANYLKAIAVEPRAKWVREKFLSPLERKLLIGTVKGTQ